MDSIIFLSVVALFALIGYFLYKAGKHKTANDEIYQQALRETKKKMT